MLLICVFCNKPVVLCCFYSPCPSCGVSTKLVTASQKSIVMFLSLNNQCPVNGSFFLDLSSVYCIYESKKVIRTRQINTVAVIKQAMHMPLGYLKVQTEEDLQNIGRRTCV